MPDINVALPIVFTPLILGGIVILLIGGDFLVRGGAALARKWRMPPLLVGLTIIAFGTSAPELVVSVQSALSGAPGLAMGNIVGSNIANFMLVLGLPALFGSLATTTPGVRRNAVFALAASGVLMLFSRDNVISAGEGAILFSLIVFYILLLAAQARSGAKDPAIEELTEVDGLPERMGPILIQLVLGLIFLPAGAQAIVTGGTGAARFLDVDESLIGLTAVAFGTSLPELATVALASMRRHGELAIGNVLGSNIFNVFAVGGATGIAAGLAGVTLPVPPVFWTLDFWVMLGSSVAIALFVFTHRPIGRLTGGLLFLGYLAYIAALAWMNLPHPA
jgi:cation:H+ antiporter